MLLLLHNGFTRLRGAEVERQSGTDRGSGLVPSTEQTGEGIFHAKSLFLHMFAY